MLFNSIDFAVFLPLVFALYWLVGASNIRLQNIIIVIASYVFYGWWDWRFLGLIFFSTCVDFLIGMRLAQTSAAERRRWLLGVSLVTNLGLLAFFKYYNFFVDNFRGAFSFFGAEFGESTLSIILPVGISFYTFQTLSYTIDVYRRELQPTNSFVDFSAFVSFFPQLVAGPIERATHLLPQFQQQRTFNYLAAVDGLRQILWGLFKKVVVADNCAEFANLIFNNSDSYNGSTLVLGALFFTFQIYGDFSGYSDIAIGTSRLFGFDLMQNFRYPYFSRNIGEFWRRWHISLSTWFRDYLYIPLGGSRGGTWHKVRNTFIIFIVSGFWHGANWTFIIWGFLNALYFLPLLLAGQNRRHLDTVASERTYPSGRELLSIGATFGLTTFAWIFFRSDSVTHAFQYITRMVTAGLLEVPNLTDKTAAIQTLVIVSVMLAIEWVGREWRHPLEFAFRSLTAPVRYVLYYAIALAIIFFGNFAENEFIYFQF